MLTARFSTSSPQFWDLQMLKKNPAWHIEFNSLFFGLTFDASNVSVVLPLFQSIYVTESCSPKCQHYLRFQSREIRLHAYYLLSPCTAHKPIWFRVTCVVFGRRKIQDLRLVNLTWHFSVPASILVPTSRTNSLYFPDQKNPTWLMTFK